MKKWLLHIVFGVLLLWAVKPVAGQGDTIKYVELGSIHSLSVPENPDYSFQWTIGYGINYVAPINPGTTTNETRPISWNFLTTYKVTVYPVLDSVNCPGEPKILYVKVVNEVTLHAMDDYYHTPEDTTVYGDVSVNDIDEKGYNLIYNTVLSKNPSNGVVIMDQFGKFSYTPNAGFIGVDFFTYSVCNDNNPSMCDNAVVTIVVEPRSGNADVLVNKTGPLKARFGGNIEYLLVVKNLGPGNATNVTLRDEMPFGVFNPVYSFGGPDFIPWPDSLIIGNLAAGDSLRVRIRGDVSPNSPRWLYNQGLVYTDNIDPDIFNNDSIWITEVLGILVEGSNLRVPACSTMFLEPNAESVNQIVSYSWSPSSNLSDASIKSPLFTPDSAGIYSYVFTITDIKGEIASDTVWVTVPEIVQVVMPDTLFIDLDSTLNISAAQSEGAVLDFSWSTINGSILSGFINDSITVGSVGTYYLSLTDLDGCTDFDSVIVLLQSHPPVAINDTIEIVAGTDSTFNVLLNDYDRNKFNLRVSDIITPPNHHDLFEWLPNGDITFRPLITYWGIDSLEYKVCNDGYPEQCSSAWVFIHSLRPPLNADVSVVKTGPEIAFWGDSILYTLTVTNHGPDTARVTVFDYLPAGMDNPIYSTNGGSTWRGWSGWHTLADSIIPPNQVEILLKAYVNFNTADTVINKAWIETDILENNLANDTTWFTTRVKDKVIARAGPDLAVGDCEDGLQLDASLSGGRDLIYRWSPSTHLSNANIATPYFKYNGSTNVALTLTYVLTVTDDDGIEDTDTLKIIVLPPPVANAGPDRFMETGAQVMADGSRSSGVVLSYSWTTTDGRIAVNGKTAQPIIDTLGTYYLEVTDLAGCTDQDEMSVFQFYFHPFAIPDYYSTTRGQTITGNVIYNDHEPNHQFNLYATPFTNRRTKFNGLVSVDAAGIMTYTAPFAGIDIVDEFTYEVCNDAVPPRCSRGYVKITVTNTLPPPAPPVANLSIQKEPVTPVVLAGKDVEWVITVTNHGPEAVTNYFITDSLSEYLEAPFFRAEDGNSYIQWNNPGQFSIPNLAVGAKKVFKIKAKVKTNAPSIVFNAATVSTANRFDNFFDWDDVPNRNVDTASVRVESDLLAKVKLVEGHPNDNNWTDKIIGACDRLSYLTGVESLGEDIESYSWSPRDLLLTPDSIKTFIKPGVQDTVVVFTLVIVKGDEDARKFSFDTIRVDISPQPIAKAGPDRKMNLGEELVIDASETVARNAFINWWDADTRESITRYDDGDKLRPIIDRTGAFVLYVRDMHGCESYDTVRVRENNLFAVNDMALVVEGHSIHGNVAFNDYDPDGDLIYYPGNVTRGPSNGILQFNPPQLGAIDTLTDNRVIAPDGSYVYTPTPGFTGFDQFTYEVCDNNDPNLCLTATVFIKVIDTKIPNSPPTANADAFFVNRGDTLIANVIINDFDIDGNQVFTQTLITRNPRRGAVTINRDGDIRYIPADGLSGYDEFAYRLCDDGNPVECDTTVVGIHVYKIVNENHPPVAVDDALFVVEKSETGSVLDNDYDPDKGDDIKVMGDIVAGPFNGTVQGNKLNFDGTYVYTPNVGFEGTDWFVYEICDDNPTNRKCSYATVYIACIDESRFWTDVSVVKTAPAEIVSNNYLEYTLKVKVNGPTFANDVVLYDTINPYLLNPQYSLDGLTWSNWADSLYWDRLVLGEEKVVTIRGMIPADADTTISNTAWVWHDMNELDSVNNQSTVQTRIFQRVVANAGRDTILGACAEKYTLNASASTGMNNATLQYQWKPASRLTNANTATPTFTTVPGTHIFSVIVTNTHRGFTDSDTAQVIVVVHPFPVANAGEDVWPEDNKDPVTLDGSQSTGVGPLTYYWWYHDRNNVLVELGNTSTVSVHRTGNYWLTITDAMGCEISDMVRVGYPIDPYVAMPDYFEIYQQHTDTIFVLDNDLIDEYDEYVWPMLILNGPYHGTVRTDPATMSVIYTPEDYFCAAADSFEYSISTSSGQTSSAWVYIDVLCLDAVVPFGFSPNGDGINDQLIIENIDLYPRNKFQVFNRWGNLVYYKEGYSNDNPWNGIANKGLRIGSGVLPTAAYIYILDLGEIGTRNEHRRIIKGYLYIASDNR